MAAINGVRKSSVVKRSKGRVSGLAIVLSVVITLLVAELSVLLFWKYYYQAEFTNQVVMSIQSGQMQVYKATRDITGGEYIEGAVELVTIPSTIINETLIDSSMSISNLKASGNIKANSIITTMNSFDPKMESAVTNTTREYTIDYLKTPGVEVGDFIDIRIKTWKQGDENSYDDAVVASKIEILSKEENGSIRIRLNEAEILNLNSAVIEAAGVEGDKTLVGDIYVGTYTHPATQPKANMTYDGKGITYTQEELMRAQEALRNEVNGQQTAVNNPSYVDNTTTTGEVEGEENTEPEIVDSTEFMTNTEANGAGTVENNEGGQG